MPSPGHPKMENGSIRDQSKSNPEQNHGDTLTDDSSEWRDASLSIGNASDLEEVDLESETLSQASESTLSTPQSIKMQPQQSRVEFQDLHHDDIHSNSAAESVSQRKRSLSSFRATCLKDGYRLIDFVLAYKINKDAQMEKMHSSYRDRFERALLEKGLELEFEFPQTSLDGQTGFVKIHSPFAILQRQAELKRLQKPFMISDISQTNKRGWCEKIFARFCAKDPFKLQAEFEHPHVEYFTDAFERDRSKEFLRSDDELAFFTSAQRAYLTWDIISTTHIEVEQEDTKEIFVVDLFKKAPWKKSKRVQETSLNEPGATVVSDQATGTDDHDQDKDQPDPMDQDADADQDQPDHDADQDQPDHDADQDQPDHDADQDQPDHDADQDQPDHDADQDQDDQDQPDPDDQCQPESEDEDGKRVSFHFLLNMAVYAAAYPLHDSDIVDDEQLSNLSSADWPLRKYLYETWARPRQWTRRQPLNAIRDYYGEKVGMYFAFVGFYTKMLIWPSIMGVLATIYGLISIPFDDISRVVCGGEFSDDVICPDCPTAACPYMKVKNYCHMSKVAAVFDSNITIFFSIFMAIWAVCFLEFWKRYSSELSVEWDVSSAEFGEENLRPEYVLKAPDKRLNPVTMNLEPYVSKSSKFKRLAASLSTVLFFIVVVIGLLTGIMLYKVIGQGWWKTWLHDDDARKKQSRNEYGLIVSITASLINGVFIAIMTHFYLKIAWILTQAEFPRTDHDFEYSYTYKVFIFQCVNYYGALFYLAIIRGRRSDPPHEQSILDTRCPLTGCLVDVSIQLAVIMVGKQAINNTIEIGIPLIAQCWSKLKRRRMSKKNESQKVLASWERDFYLQRHHRIPLFSDYLELLIQYGFTTLFVVGFPLAPFFALLNNIMEIRLDAYKTLVYTQRCVPLRSRNIGPWFGLLKTVTRVAVITNAVVIAFTTRFVDRMVYDYGDGRDWAARNNLTNSDHAYFFYSTTSYNTSDCPRCNTDLNSMNTTKEYDTCYFVGYTSPHDDPIEAYVKTLVWWHILAWKFVFVVVFENVILAFQSLLAYFIPDVSQRTKLRAAREKFLLKVNFLRKEFKEKSKRHQSTESDPDEKFIPDELPDWIEDVQSTLPSTSGTGIQRSENAGGMKRSKMLVPRERRKKQPFMIMLFRKLMLCD